MNAIYVLVLLSGAQAGPAPVDRLYDKGHCEAAGKQWVEAARAQRIPYPTYVCFISHSR